MHKRRIEPLATALSMAALFAFTGCSKKPSQPPGPPPKAAAPSATAMPASPATSGVPGATPSASPGAKTVALAPAETNPAASSDPVFNMPRKPVLDVSASEKQLSAIAAAALK